MISERPASSDLTRTILLVSLQALLVLASFWVLSPFLMPLLWATIVSIAVWPFLLRLQRELGGRRGPAVAIVTALILLVIFVPVTLAFTTIINNAESITSEIKSLETIVLPGPPNWLAHMPLFGKDLASRWAAFVALGPAEREAFLVPHLQTALLWFAAQAGSLGTMLLEFVLTTIITAILLTKGETVRDGILRFVERLGGRQGHDVTVLAARAVRGVVLGVVVTALVQSAVGGLGLLITGIPAAGLFTAVMLFLCLAQLGPVLVLVPAVVWLYWTGQTVLGTVLLVISVVAGTIDSVVRPVLIRRGVDLPLLLIFAGVIGGLVAFGIIGLFVGPVVLTVTFTLLKAWVSGVKPPEGQASALGGSSA
jgi:predicted PurR-regulated permease PerM